MNERGLEIYMSASSWEQGQNWKEIFGEYREMRQEMIKTSPSDERDERDGERGKREEKQR
jgi:hypothetical protein